ncbi:MAG: tryptophan synthase subunit alpha [Candidatus Sumerlaeia bacterium]
MSEAQNRIDAKFAENHKEGKKSLVLFLSAGFPNLETTEEIIEALDQAGTDILELGVPFSDPVADGPTIQEASRKALLAGTTLEKILDMVGRVREKSDMPILLFGAYNPFFHYGLEKLVKKAVEVGVDGFLVPDLPMEESDEFHDICEKNNLSLVYLVAVTTPEERAAQIAQKSTGFIYFVSMKGVTGTSLEVSDSLKQQVAQLKSVSGGKPVAVGFGIRTPEQAAQIGAITDAVVVGSQLIRVVEKGVEDGNVAEAVTDYAKSLKDAIS